MIKPAQLHKLMILRGFGYHEIEIAERIGVSRKTVSNHLALLNLQAETKFEEGKSLDEIFFSLFPIVLPLKLEIKELNHD